MSSKVLISENILSDIADSIRAKKGTTDLIKTSELASEIETIETHSEVNLNKKRIGKPINPNEIMHTLYFNDWLTDEELADILIRELSNGSYYMPDSCEALTLCAIPGNPLVWAFTMQEDSITLHFPHSVYHESSRESVHFRINLKTKEYSWPLGRPPHKMSIPYQEVDADGLIIHYFSPHRFKEILSFNEEFEEIDLTEEEKEIKKTLYFGKREPNTFVIEEEDETSPLIGNPVNALLMRHIYLNKELSVAETAEIINGIDLSQAMATVPGIGKAAIYFYSENVLVAAVKNFNTLINNILQLPNEDDLGLESKGLIFNIGPALFFFTTESLALSSLTNGSLPDLEPGWYITVPETYETIPLPEGIDVIQVSGRIAPITTGVTNYYYGDPEDLRKILSFDKPFSHSKKKKIVNVNYGETLTKNSNKSETPFELNKVLSIYINPYIGSYSHDEIFTPFIDTVSMFEEIEDDAVLLEIKTEDSNDSTYKYSYTVKANVGGVKGKLEIELGSAQLTVTYPANSEEEELGIIWADMLLSLAYHTSNTGGEIITEIIATHPKSDLAYNFISPVPFKDTGYSVVEKEEDSGEEQISPLKALLDDKKSAEGLFKNTTFEDVSHLIKYEDTENVTNTKQMFYQCMQLKTVPQLNTSNVTDMSYMFQTCAELTSIPQLDTSKVTKMNGMFQECFVLTSIPQLDTSKVTDVDSMFRRCNVLTDISVDFSNITGNYRTTNIFQSCTNLQTVSLVSTSKATNLNNLFYGCKNLTSISGLDTSNCTDTSYMFYQCEKLTTIPELNTSKATNMSYMFQYCTALTSVPQLDTSSATDISYMFYGCSSLTTIPQLNTSKATKTNSMFYKCTNLASIPLLDTSNSTNMYGMFGECSSLTTIPQLNTSKVTDMSNMFIQCAKLTTIPTLNTSNVTKMEQMFASCYKLTSVPQLDTSKVTSINSMFKLCSNLTKVDFINTDNVTRANDTFYSCNSLTKVIIRNMTKVPPISSNTFYNCYHFDGTRDSRYNPEGLKDGRIYVPDDMVDTLKVATNWAVYADCIVPLSTLEE